jgi:small subunit ribosomal protein S7
MTEKLLLFGKYSADGVIVTDPGIAKYLNLSTPLVPHSHGRLAKKTWRRLHIPVVERLINKVMRTGQGRRKLSGKFIRGRGVTGNKMLAMRIVNRAFEQIERESKQNPMQVLVQAIENSAPREDTTKIQRGGISYTVSVDVGPQRRIDESLKNIALAAFQKSFKSKTSASEALAREILLASKEDNQSFAIKRRDEIERIAKSSR